MNRKLMIVDDSNLIRKKIAREFDQNRFDLVASAENGEKAIELFKEFKPEIITMDITMPHLDGIDCIEQLIAIQPDVKILVISALNDKATGMEALEKGAMGFINKPFSQQGIIDALATLVEDD